MSIGTKMMHMGIIVAACVLAYMSFNVSPLLWCVSCFIIGRHAAVLHSGED